MSLKHPLFIALLLFVFAIAMLLPGIGQETGITGKDEYLLSMRTPMYMIEGQHGWMPWLDGAPRLRKPPLLYWIGKLSYEAFGVSLTSARIIGVFFAALLVMATALIAWQLGGSRQYMLLAGLVMLGSAGIMIDGRRMMLDIPVAAFSALSVLSLLVWQRSGALRHALLFGLALGLGFLVKGPVALIFAGAGFIALMITDQKVRGQVRRSWSHLLLALFCFAIVTLPWFAWVYMTYPERFMQTIGEEIGARSLASFSLDPLFNIFILLLPWSPAALVLLLRRDMPPEDQIWLGRRRFLLWWLLLSLLPFFFFKSFGRYLYGAMIPLALLTACLACQAAYLARYRAWFRVGAAISLLTGSLFVAAVLWFRDSGPLMLLPLVLTVVFIIAWWRADNLTVMAVSAVLYWSSVIGIVYPRIGINAIPEAALELSRNENVVLYAGPQPAMLPIASGRAMFVTNRLRTLPGSVIEDCRGLLLFSPHKHWVTAHTQLKEMGFRIVPVRRFHILSSRGSWLRFAREGATIEDWKQAIRQHDLDSLGTDVILIRAIPQSCSID